MINMSSKKNKDLFLRDDGTPMVFHLPPGSTKKKLSSIIKEHGGEITSRHLAKMISLADESLYESRRRITDNHIYWPTFVLDCVDQRCLLDLDIYRCTRGIRYMRKIPSLDGSEDKMEFDFTDGLETENIVEKKGRMHYTKADDMKMIKYLINHGEYRRAKGRAVWKTMEKLQITEHSAQSMMTRFRKVILDQLEEYNIPDAWKVSLSGNPARFFTAAAKADTDRGTERASERESDSEQPSSPQPSTSRSSHITRSPSKSEHVPPYDKILRKTKITSVSDSQEMPLSDTQEEATSPKKNIDRSPSDRRHKTITTCDSQDKTKASPTKNKTRQTTSPLRNKNTVTTSPQDKATASKATPVKNRNAKPVSDGSGTEADMETDNESVMETDNESGDTFDCGLIDDADKPKKKDNPTLSTGEPVINSDKRVTVASADELEPVPSTSTAEPGVGASVSSSGRKKNDFREEEELEERHKDNVGGKRKRLPLKFFRHKASKRADRQREEASGREEAEDDSPNHDAALTDPSPTHSRREKGNVVAQNTSQCSQHKSKEPPISSSIVTSSGNMSASIATCSSRDGANRPTGKPAPRIMTALGVLRRLRDEFDITFKEAVVLLRSHSGDVKATRYCILTGRHLHNEYCWTKEEDMVLQDCEPDHPAWQLLENRRGLPLVLQRIQWLLANQ